MLAPFSAAAADIRPPFALREPSPLSGNAPCATPPKPLIELAVASKYGNSGSERDSVSPEAEAQARVQLSPLREFSDEVVRMANRYAKSGDSSEAACALAWLDSWSQANALTQMKDHNAWFEQGAAIAGLGFAAAQISPAVATDPRYHRVAEWLRKAIGAGMQYFDSTRQLQGSRNNHLYWAALGAAATAVAANDRHLLDWAMDQYKAGVCSATPEGGLPLELARGSKALDYHFFALEPLVSIAAVADANGIPAFDECNGAIHRIVKFALDGLADPARIEKLAGKKQDAYPNGMPSKAHLAWMEMYARRFPGKAPMEAKILALRPLAATNLGGDQTLLYRR